MVLEHVTTTYWPLTGSFYPGNQSGAVMKNNYSLKPIASLTGNSWNASKDRKLMSRDTKFALMASSIKAGGALRAAADPVNLAFQQHNLVIVV